MSIEDYSTNISAAIAGVFPYYRFVINKCGGLLMVHLYETARDPVLLLLEEKEATHFLALSFHFAGGKLEIESLRKTAHMSGKEILQQIYKLSTTLCIKEIHVEDNAMLEFDVEKVNNQTQEDTPSKDTRKRITAASWQTVKVKTMPLSPLLILCGQPGYYPEKGLYKKGKKKKINIIKDE